MKTDLVNTDQPIKLITYTPITEPQLDFYTYEKFGFAPNQIKYNFEPIIDKQLMYAPSRMMYEILNYEQQAAYRARISKTYLLARRNGEGRRAAGTLRGKSRLRNQKQKTPSFIKLLILIITNKAAD